MSGDGWHELADQAEDERRAREEKLYKEKFKNGFYYMVDASGKHFSGKSFCTDGNSCAKYVTSNDVMQAFLNHMKNVSAQYGGITSSNFSDYEKHGYKIEHFTVGQLAETEKALKILQSQYEKQKAFANGLV